MAAKLRSPKELVITAKPNIKFEALVRELERALTIPRGKLGLRGCAPCNSGIDRVVIENPAFRSMR